MFLHDLRNISKSYPKNFKTVLLKKKNYSELIPYFIKIVLNHSLTPRIGVINVTSVTNKKKLIIAILSDVTVFVAVTQYKIWF